MHQVSENTAVADMCMPLGAGRTARSDMGAGIPSLVTGTDAVMRAMFFNFDTGEYLVNLGLL